MASQNILILSSNTGGGHWSAAKALENSFISLSPGEMLVKITQVLEEGSLFSRKAADLYNFLLRDHQSLMRYYFWLINKLRPNESKLLFKSSMHYAVKLLDRVVPSAVVSVHPMAHHFFAYVLKKLNLAERVPLVTVVTDPYEGFWRGWACDDVARYYVASDHAKQQLIDYGVPDTRILVPGMPVHARFKPVQAFEKESIRQELGLIPNRFTVFINAGWIGGGNIPMIYEALLRQAPAALSHPDQLQVVFLAGQNSLLRYQAERLGEQRTLPVSVFGYTSEMERLMQASDVLVSKLGGLTTFEALSCGLPIIADTVTPPMPQEAQTAAFIERTGSGVLLKKPAQIVSVVESLMNSSQYYNRLKESAAFHGRPGASERIALDILQFIGSPAVA